MSAMIWCEWIGMHGVRWGSHSHVLLLNLLFSQIILSKFSLYTHLRENLKLWNSLVHRYISLVLEYLSRFFHRSKPIISFNQYMQASFRLLLCPPIWCVQYIVYNNIFEVTLSSMLLTLQNTKTHFQSTCNLKKIWEAGVSCPWQA